MVLVHFNTPAFLVLCSSLLGAASVTPVFFSFCVAIDFFLLLLFNDFFFVVQ
jgi:hypothetical protein